MSAIRTAMEAYPYVFHPITVLAAGVLALIYVEWRRLPAADASLYRRVAGFLVAGVLALLPTAAYVLGTGSDAITLTEGNAWQVDALVGGGVLIAAGVTWWLWRRRRWGSIVPRAMEALAAVTLPYLALSPFWNVSGHVIVTLMPALYLTLVDRRFWPSLAIPLVMVPNRVYLSAHTWAQSVGGFLLATAVVLAVFRLQDRSSTRGSVDVA